MTEAYPFLSAAEVEDIMAATTALVGPATKELDTMTAAYLEAHNQAVKMSEELGYKFRVSFVMNKMGRPRFTIELRRPPVMSATHDYYDDPFSEGEGHP